MVPEPEYRQTGKPGTTSVESVRHPSSFSEARIRENRSNKAKNIDDIPSTNNTTSATVKSPADSKSVTVSVANFLYNVCILNL